MDANDRRRAFEGEKRKQIKKRTALLSDTRAEIVRLLEDARARIAATLAAQPSDYQRWYLPQLQKEIERVLADFSREAGAAVSQAASRAWELGEESIAAPLEAAGVRVPPPGTPAPTAAATPAPTGGAVAGVAPVIDTRLLFAMRAFMTDRIKDIGVQAANKINSELGLVVIGAQTPSDAVTRVTEILGEPSRARATRIVRDNLASAHAAAAQQHLEESARHVPGLKKQWKRSGKQHPRLTHFAAHDQVREATEPFDIGGVRMMHPHDPKAPIGEKINCGCMSVPFKASWKDAA